MCPISSHDRKPPTHVDDTRSACVREIHKYATTEALKLPDATLNFIDCWLKTIQRNYQGILILYHDAMIDLFKQIPTMKLKLLLQYKYHQFLLTYISGSYSTEKIIKKLPPL